MDFIPVAFARLQDIANWSVPSFGSTYVAAGGPGVAFVSNLFQMRPKSQGRIARKGVSCVIKRRFGYGKTAFKRDSSKKINDKRG